MKFTFVSNYINHHQLPMAKKMYEILKEDYAFIETQPMTEERQQLGWGEDGQIPFVYKYYEQEALCKQKILESDIVMFGGVDEDDYILERLQLRKPVIRYAERFYKEGRIKAISPRGLRRKYKEHTKYRKAPVYLLCAGAYVALDYDIVCAYPKKKFTWGYFPENRKYGFRELFSSKCITEETLENFKKNLTKDFLFTEEKKLETEKGTNSNTKESMESVNQENEKSKTIKLLWAGRMIPWKHPSDVLRLAKDLKKQRDLPKFEITMIGSGILEEDLKKQAKEQGVEDCITFTGSMKPAMVREYMEKSDIYLFTSDYMEGWGAVMNEAMNSGMCVVANAGIGAAHSLIHSGENGLLYPNGEYESFLSHVKGLMLEEETRLSMGAKAYRTIQEKWNPDYAAEQLLALSKAICQEYEEKGTNGVYKEPKYFNRPKDGPMSRPSLY